MAVRFTTRLESWPASRREGPATAYPLYCFERAARSARRRKNVFIASSSAARARQLRNRLARDVVATDTLAVDVGRCGQGGKSKYPDYAEHLQVALRARAARVPRHLHAREAARAGALAVYVYEAHMLRGSGWGASA